MKPAGFLLRVINLHTMLKLCPKCVYKNCKQALPVICRKPQKYLDMLLFKILGQGHPTAIYGAFGPRQIQHARSEMQGLSPEHS